MVRGMDESRRRRGKLGERAIRWWPYAAMAAALKIGFSARGSVIPAVSFGILVLAAGELARRRMSLERARGAARSKGRWPLGLPYPAEVIERGVKAKCQVVFDEESIARESRLGLKAEELPLARVRTVRVRPSWIEIAWPGGAFRISPGSYDDRQRLLWELAVRLPDAMERAMDEDAERDRAAAAKRDAPAPAAADPAPPVGGLASALAGPGASSNPPPPRKSGLGVGLFAPPPSR
jgi:hypothetical protein